MTIQAEIKRAVDRGYRVRIGPGGSDTGDSGGPYKVDITWTKWRILEGLPPVHYSHTASAAWSTMESTIRWVVHLLDQRRKEGGWL